MLTQVRMDSRGWQKACPVEVRAGKKWSDRMEVKSLLLLFCSQ